MRQPLSGYNHNVRYRSRVYHVQTEDFGMQTPQVCSHLFFNGAVLSSARLTYQELVAQPNHEAQLSQMMREQHKSLIRRLIHGELDDRIATMLGSIEPKKDERKVAGYCHRLEYARRVYSVQTRYAYHAVTDVYQEQTLVYSERGDCGNVGIEAVRRLAQEQHKRVLRTLRDGGYDSHIVRVFATLEPQRAQPGSRADPGKAKVLLSALCDEPQHEAPPPERQPDYCHRVRRAERVLTVGTWIGGREICTEVKLGDELLTRTAQPRNNVRDEIEWLAQKQHKEIIVDIRDGGLDETIELLAELEGLQQ